MTLAIIGFTFSLFITSGLHAATIEKIPPSPLVYYEFGQPVAISFIATLDDNGLMSKEQTTSVALYRFSDPVLQYGPIWNNLLIKGNVTLNRNGTVFQVSASSPQPSTILVTFSLPFILDGNYRCAVLFFSLNLETRFQVFTTRAPDGIFITTGIQRLGSMAPMVLGADATVTCSVINSKPHYNLFWETTVGLSETLTWPNDDNKLVNTSISLVVTPSLGIHGTRITCRGVSSVIRPDLPNVTDTATITVAYGPTGYTANVSHYRSTAAVITCQLMSYPDVVAFTWAQDGQPIACTARTCDIRPSGKASQLKCQGSNPMTKRTATGIINIAWADGSRTPVADSSNSSSEWTWIPVITVMLGAAAILATVWILKRHNNVHTHRTPSDEHIAADQ